MPSKTRRSRRQIIDETLAKLDGCCLDNEPEKRRVARALDEALAELDVSCAGCGVVLVGTYWQLDGKDLCGTCHHGALELRETKTRGAR